MGGRGLFVLLSLGGLTLTACSVLFSWDRYVGEEPVPAAEGGPAAEAGGPGDGGVDADAGPTYFAFDDDARWESFDPRLVSALANDFSGVTFDGRWVYFAPFQPFLLRHDASRALADAAGWEAVDVRTLGGGAAAFHGATFDGRYVYFGPADRDRPIAGRFDTMGVLGDRTAWSFFDLRAIAATAGINYRGVLLSGGDHVYYAPHSVDPPGPAQVVLRYKRSGDFASASAWETVRLTVGLFYGGASFDPSVVLLGPELGDRVARHDDTQPLDAGWTSFAPAILEPSLDRREFRGAVHAAGYAFFVPYTAPLAARYDPKLPLEGAGSWAFTRIPRTGGTRFSGGAFDGRHVYFAPVGADDVSLPRDFVRYDTTSGFASESAWERHPVGPPDGGPRWIFGGATFTGRHVYFSPASPGVPVVRFEARAAGPLPEGARRSAP